jgi:hypothetical protein
MPLRGSAEVQFFRQAHHIAHGVEVHSDPPPSSVAPQLPERSSLSPPGNSVGPAGPAVAFGAGRLAGATR